MIDLYPEKTDMGTFHINTADLACNNEHRAYISAITLIDLLIRTCPLPDTCIARTSEEVEQTAMVELDI